MFEDVNFEGTKCSEVHKMHAMRKESDEQTYERNLWVLILGFIVLV